MRWMLVAAMLLLAGCTDGEGSLNDEAEAARAQALEDAGPNGSLSRLEGTLAMAFQFGDDSMEMDGDINVRLHVDDAFTMDVVLQMVTDDGTERIAGTFTCSPKRLTVSMEGLDERVDEPNAAGTCLDLDSSGPLAFLGAFEGLSEMGLGELDMLPYGNAPFTDVQRDGNALVASFTQDLNLQGMEALIEGTWRIVDGTVRSTQTTVSGAYSEGGFNVAMELDMETIYHYGARSLGP